MAKRNAAIVLQYSTVYPFRMRGRAFLCVYCNEGYEDPTHFRRHVDCNHKKFNVSAAFAHVSKGKEYLKVDCANLECRLCTEPFSNVKDAAEHLLKEHGRKVNLKYDIALQCFKLEKDRWYCLHCDAKLPSITKLCRHTVTHYQKFTCDICGKTYLTVEGLRYHTRCTHSGKLFCRKCWKEFPTTEERMEHQKTSKTCWNFGCIYCGERFQSWEMKNKHLVEKHDCPEFKYPCPDCDSVFDSRKRFNNHYNKIHTDEGYVCSFCDKKFSSQALLKQHKVVHAGLEEGYKCSVCSKSFPKKFTLTQHMWIHSEVKRFACKPCNKQFNQKVSYKTHMKVHHGQLIE